jgi:hypothetical protein
MEFDSFDRTYSKLKGQPRASVRKYVPEKTSLLMTDGRENRRITKTLLRVRLLKKMEQEASHRQQVSSGNANLLFYLLLV